MKKLADLQNRFFLIPTTGEKPMIMENLYTNEIYVSCSEDEINAIICSLADLTKQCAQMTDLTELPDPQSLRYAIMPAKRILARLMTNELGRVVNHDDLSRVSLEIVSHAGYFRVTLTEVTLQTAQSFDIIISNTLRMPFMVKVLNAMQLAYPQMSEKEHAVEATKYLQGL
jgi:hypothetical protein